MDIHLEDAGVAKSDAGEPEEPHFVHLSPELMEHLARESTPPPPAPVPTAVKPRAVAQATKPVKAPAPPKPAPAVVRAPATRDWLPLDGQRWRPGADAIPDAPATTPPTPAGEAPSEGDVLFDRAAVDKYAGHGG